LIITVILPLLAKHAIVEAELANFALEYYHQRHQLSLEETNVYHETFCKMNSFECAQKIPIDYSRLTAPYLAGLFAAEGYVGAKLTGGYLVARCCVGQSSCIRKFMGLELFTMAKLYSQVIKRSHF